MTLHMNDDIVSRCDYDAGSKQALDYSRCWEVCPIYRQTAPAALLFVLTVYSDAGDAATHKQERITSAGASVTEKQQKGTNQAKLSSLFPRAHIESQETILPTVAITLSKGGKASFQPSELYTKLQPAGQGSH